MGANLNKACWHWLRFALPLRAPLPSGGRVRQGGVVIVEAEGMRGWGEVAPLPGLSLETLEEAEQALKACICRLPNQLPEHPELLAAVLKDVLRAVPASVRWGIELALAGWMAAWTGKRLDAWLAPSPLPVVAVNALIASEADPSALLALREAGYSVVKLKVGRQSLAADIQRVRQVRAVLGPKVEIRLDANRAWKLSEALAFAEAVADLHIAYLEEPVKNVEDLAAFAHRSPIPLALDETLAAFPEQPLANWAFARVVVLKPMCLGGVFCALERAREAQALGMQVVWSSAFESGVGTRGVLALAAASQSHAAAGLDPYRWLAADTVWPSLALGPIVSVPEVLGQKLTCNQRMLTHGFSA
ncbi:o-succinylbenzoate synthase [bacterium HR18]|nr:o-succinylbenzoate synthase [bacterium HR18]